jgi:hypothetical protein
MNRSFWRIAALLACVAVTFAPVQAQEGGWGGVKGQITWGGPDVPKREPLDLKENPDKPACLKNGPLLDETWVVNPKNKGLRHVFVWLQAPKGSELPIHPALKDIKEKKIVMDQPICMFIPHALALREGQVLVAKNSAAVVHNFKWSGHPEINPGNNVLLPPGTEKVIDDLKADRFPVSIECNIHPWMRGWVRIFDHPYYAVTDEHGNFAFKDAPAGQWQLMIWHAQGWLGGAKGRNGQPITIKAGSVTDVGSLAYPPPAN